VPKAGFGCRRNQFSEGQCYPRAVTQTLEREPACPGADEPAEAVTPAVDGRPGARDGRLRADHRPFDSIRPELWDALAMANPWSTPFSRWGFHRAWWDAYSGSAHDQTVVVVDPASPERPVAIVPLMHRHAVEPSDAANAAHMRHGSGAPLTPVEPHAKAIFFGASYHADYATVLSAPDDLRAVSDAVVDYLAGSASTGHGAMPWDVVDLRRLRCGDPAADELAAAFGRREMTAGWTLNLEREDVCPVLTLPDVPDFEGYLATLSKKDRHEVRRKLRRAETKGEVRLEDSPDPLRDFEAFIELHQKRWGADGLFRPTPGGEASRRFFARLFELMGRDGGARLTFLTVGGRRIASGVHLETADGYLYFNAGVDPDARELSPGVLMVARYIERAIKSGKRRLDFLRGDEPYKYEWGAVDEPIQRLLVRRAAA
jgi:CelD/BcsL family acetyltransferase involved in cellulose biosynthesis